MKYYLFALMFISSLAFAMDDEDREFTVEDALTEWVELYQYFPEQAVCQLSSLLSKYSSREIVEYYQGLKKSKSMEQEVIRKLRGDTLVSLPSKKFVHSTSFSIPSRSIKQVSPDGAYSAYEQDGILYLQQTPHSGDSSKRKKLKRPVAVGPSTAHFGLGYVGVYALQAKGNTDELHFSVGDMQGKAEVRNFCLTNYREYAPLTPFIFDSKNNRIAWLALNTGNARMLKILLFDLSELRGMHDCIFHTSNRSRSNHSVNKEWVSFIKDGNFPQFCRNDSLLVVPTPSALRVYDAQTLGLVKMIKACSHQISWCEQEGLLRILAYPSAHEKNSLELYEHDLLSDSIFPTKVNSKRFHPGTRLSADGCWVVSSAPKITFCEPHNLNALDHLTKNEGLSPASHHKLEKAHQNNPIIKGIYQKKDETLIHALINNQHTALLYQDTFDLSDTSLYGCLFIKALQNLANGGLEQSRADELKRLISYLKTEYFCFPDKLQRALYARYGAQLPATVFPIAHAQFGDK